MSLPLLSLCTFVPLIGAAAILAMPSANNTRHRTPSHAIENQ